MERLVNRISNRREYEIKLVGGEIIRKINIFRIVVHTKSRERIVLGMNLERRAREIAKAITSAAHIRTRQRHAHADNWNGRFAYAHRNISPRILFV